MADGLLLEAQGNNMGVVVLLIAVVAVALLICIGLNTKIRAAQARLHSELAGRSSLEDKLTTLRKELSSAKEELTKKSKLLDEAKEIGRKKMKKEAIQAGREQEVENAQTDVEVDRLKRALHAMEAQLQSFKSEAERQLKSQLEHQSQAHREAVKHLEIQLSKRQHETLKKKQGLEQTLPAIDVAAWSDDTVNEVARLLRKAEQLEKMNGVTHGKLQMAQERFSELQRRYFAVCRELALAAGKGPEVSDQQARDVAEAIASETN